MKNLKNYVVTDSISKEEWDDMRHNWYNSYEEIEALNHKASILDNIAEIAVGAMAVFAVILPMLV